MKPAVNGVWFNKGKKKTGYVDSEVNDQNSEGHYFILTATGVSMFRRIGGRDALEGRPPPAPSSRAIPDPWSSRFLPDRNCQLCRQWHRQLLLPSALEHHMRPLAF